MNKDREEPIRWDVFEKETHSYSDGNAVRQNDEENMPVLYELPKKKVQVKKKILPTIFIAIFSALSIGLILGMVTLQMFVNIEQPSSGGSHSPIVPLENQENEIYTVPSLSSFMLQAGVFTDLTNAEMWQLDFEQREFPTKLWERDGQWYLFIGIYYGKEEAQSMVENLRVQGIDVFVKPWNVEEIQIELSNNEADHLNDLEEVWNESLMNRDSELLQSSVRGTEEYEEISPLGNVEMNNNAEQFFLDWLFQYEQLGK